jgi:hypothetical protein
MPVDRLLFPRPEAERLVVERTPMDARCDACGSTDVARYPVANFLGPRIVTKCQACFHHLDTRHPEPGDHWPPWQAATVGWSATRAG